MPDWLGLDGQRVVVAGGAGTIGSALVAGFLDAGASLGVIDLDASAVDTRVGATEEADLSDPDAARESLRRVREGLSELIPAGRFGTLPEVVDPVLFLCSPRASFITGQVIYIDGGRTIV